MTVDALPGMDQNQAWTCRTDRGLEVQLADRTWSPVPVPEADLAGWDFGDGRPEPTRITQALDLRGLYGHEVDLALGCTDLTEVDQWEAGTLAPTRVAIARLAALTGMVPGWFYGPPVAPVQIICLRYSR